MGLPKKVWERIKSLKPTYRRIDCGGDSARIKGSIEPRAVRRNRARAEGKLTHEWRDPRNRHQHVNGQHVVLVP